MESPAGSLCPVHSEEAPGWHRSASALSNTRCQQQRLICFPRTVPGDVLRGKTNTDRSAPAGGFWSLRVTPGLKGLLTRQQIGNPLEQRRRALCCAQSPRSGTRSHASDLPLGHGENPVFVGGLEGAERFSAANALSGLGGNSKRSWLNNVAA